MRSVMIWTAARQAVLTRTLALLACLLFLATGLRLGWTRSTTDFPNYYAAAVAVKEHKPLARYFDWTWFAESMNHAGVGDHIGAYTPQTPLTMLPLLPLTRFEPQTAKRIWLAANLLLLAAALWMLTRVTRFTFAQIVLLAFCGFASFYVDFVIGQYYVIVLFLLVSVYYCLQRRRSLTAGALCAIMFGLKLYGGPFLLYFIARRNWRALAGMVAAMAFLAAVALGVFGWNDLAYYATHVLPRTLEGGSVDPYHPDNATIATLLRRLFVPEPELNPHPLYSAPWLFFLLRPLILLALLTFPLVAMLGAREGSERRLFAWFTLVVLLLSTSTARYTFLVVLLPVVLLLEDARRRMAVILIGAFIFITLPLPLAQAFWRVWLMLLLYAFAGLVYLRTLKPVWVVSTGVLVTIAACASAYFEISAYSQEPGRSFEPFAVERGQILSAFPVVTSSGVFYQAMSNGRYVLHLRHDGTIQELRFDGNALNPRAASANGPVLFELAAHGTLATMSLDPQTGAVLRAPDEHAADRVVATGQTSGSLASPDRKWTALTEPSSPGTRLLLRNLETGAVWTLGGGNCNTSSPTWELDSKAVIFASDCDRAFGTTALYRADVQRCCRR